MHYIYSIFKITPRCLYRAYNVGPTLQVVQCKCYSLCGMVYVVWCRWYGVGGMVQGLHCRPYTVGLGICLVQCTSQIECNILHIYTTYMQCILVRQAIYAIYLRMYTTQCILIQNTVYAIHCTRKQSGAQNVHCTVYSVQCTLYSVQCVPASVTIGFYVIL